MAKTVQEFPTWIRRPWPSSGAFQEVKDLLGGLDLHTVCQSAHCPNQSECWGRGTATFMVMGNTCTRHCTYCAVNSGRPEALDDHEPAKIGEAVKRLNLKHAVLTSVTRDDLPDGGAGHVAETIEAIKAVSPETTVEVLVQDFDGDTAAIERVLAAEPEIFSHNIETVRPLFPKLRDRRFTYDQSLEVLRFAAARQRRSYIKSAFMLGCGESADDVTATLEDLLAAGVQAVSIGQYLQPTPKHHAVVEFVRPETFASFEQQAYDLGFLFAVAGPFVRSSYRSETLIEERGIPTAGPRTPGA
jgi:lipoic acid synthetase